MKADGPQRDHKFEGIKEKKERDATDVADARSTQKTLTGGGKE